MPFRGTRPKGVLIFKSRPFISPMDDLDESVLSSTCYEIVFMFVNGFQIELFGSYYSNPQGLFVAFRNTGG